MAPLLSSGPSKIGALKKGPVKPGIASKSKFERHFQPGEFLFKEGDSGTEMFIIKKGKVKILKEEGSTVVELVTLGPGSVLGEMSLLDNAPRSAAAMADELVSVTIIDQNHLNTTLGKVPGWLNNVIKIVVQRLRDTTNRNYKDMLQSGFISILRCINYMKFDGVIVSGDKIFYPVDKLKELSYSIFGLSGNDADKILNHLDMLSLTTTQKNKAGKAFLKIEDPEIFEVFYDFMYTLWKGKETLTSVCSPEAQAIANSINEAGKTRAARRQELMVLDYKQLLVHREQEAEYEDIDPLLIDELEQLKLVETEKKGLHGKGGYSKIMYNPGVLKKFVIECDWGDIFMRDVTEGME